MTTENFQTLRRFTFFLLFLSFASVSYANTPDYKPWDQTLKNVVTAGRVDYRKLKSQSSNLDTFLDRISNVTEAQYEAWNTSEKIAFWLNTYNAAMMNVVIRHYPINAGFSLKGLAYPKNSVQQISDIWERNVVEVFGKQRSLNDIEHEILRKEFSEPRIHFALVCASVGCPPIRNEPYMGNRLDKQLDDQARIFLNDSEKNIITAERIEISKIFSWFAGDFGGEKGVVNFIQAVRNDVVLSDPSVSYLNYDWSLNEIS